MSFLHAESYRFLRNGPFASLIFISVALNALAAVGTGTMLEPIEHSTAELDQELTLQLVRMGFASTLFAMIHGALSVTRDFGSGGIVRQKLLAGGSVRLVASRAVVVAPQMVVFGVLGPAAAIVPAFFLLPAQGADFAWSDDASVVVVGIAVATIFSGYLGQMVAWQSRKSLITVIALAAWTMLLETYIIQLVPAVGRLLPGGLGLAMMDDTSTTEEILPIGCGYLGFAAWLILLAGLAVLRLRRTDAT
ncbi:hypothetical protein [Microbacterium stercoris]|uniref:Uncharacterized protein n=1 Tax=Microbacterium stercoris TaxID=2820289 RepID=A0A939QS64_9MICO|nr:hypothetical protein [Microbacterium stercoris]MBO3663641.1 hypothetical protein [Microbacterium stercoris]